MHPLTLYDVATGEHRRSTAERAHAQLVARRRAERQAPARQLTRTTRRARRPAAARASARLLPG